MEFKAVQFTSPSRKVFPDCLVLKFGTPRAFETFRDTARRPSALVVPLESLPELEKYKDLVAHRGLKNPNKGLSAYLSASGRSKIPLIEGSYSSAPRVKQGVRAMLQHAIGGKGPPLFFVGVESAVFGQLWDGSAKHHLAQQPPEGQTNRGAGPKSDMFSWLINELGAQCDAAPDLGNIYIGHSEEAELVRRLIVRAAQNDSPILILGDTGTGKEIVARQIHARSTRQNGPFIPVNCGGIPQDLMESELFGHLEGAFTGATKDKTGLWQAAGEGTLFLDEIGELTQVDQAKILRALEDGSIRRVGDTREIRVDARIIAATNRDLFNMVQTGRFREDLYYRLSGFFIRTPALRNHPEDIPLIAQYLWQKITGDPARHLPQALVDELTAHQWPGNVRELKMVLNHLFNLFPNENLQPRHLRGVTFLAGRPELTTEEPLTDKELVLHRAGCLRHLKRAHEVIDVTGHILKKLLSTRGGGRDIARLRTSLNLRIHEFEKLCRTPLLFHGQQTFTAVNTLGGKMTWLLGLLLKNREDALSYWKLEVADSFRTALKMVFAEIEKLLAES